MSSIFSGIPFDPNNPAYLALRLALGDKFDAFMASQAQPATGQACPALWQASEACHDGKKGYKIDLKNGFVVEAFEGEVFLKHFDCKAKMTDCTRVWGDPHVDEQGFENNKLQWESKDWDFKANNTNLTFKLPDGTKITFETAPVKGKDGAPTFTTAIFISNGDQAYAISGLASDDNKIKLLDGKYVDDGDVELVKQDGYLDRTIPDGIVVVYDGENGGNTGWLLENKCGPAMQMTTSLADIEEARIEAQGDPSMKAPPPVVPVPPVPSVSPATPVTPASGVKPVTPKLHTVENLVSTPAVSAQPVDVVAEKPQTSSVKTDVVLTPAQADSTDVPVKEQIVQGVMPDPVPVAAPIVAAMTVQTPEVVSTSALSQVQEATSEPSQTVVAEAQAQAMTQPVMITPAMQESVTLALAMRDDQAAVSSPFSLSLPVSEPFQYVQTGDIWRDDMMAFAFSPFRWADLFRVDTDREKDDRAREDRYRPANR